MREIKFKKADSIKAIAELASYCDSLDDSNEYVITVKEIKRKRSLDANAYFWVMLDKLAMAMRTSKLDLYRDYIKNIGGNSDMLVAKEIAVARLVKVWESNGLGWCVDILPHKAQGFKTLVMYYGSSTFDSLQMSVLIDRVVQDCQSIGIDTMSKTEIQKMLDDWGE